MLHKNQTKRTTKKNKSFIERNIKVIEENMKEIKSGKIEDKKIDMNTEQKK